MIARLASHGRPSGSMPASSAAIKAFSAIWRLPWSERVAARRSCTALAAADLPLSGQVRLELDTAALRISDAWCDLSLAAGRLVHPAFQEGALPVTSGQLRIAYDPAQGRATIEDLSIDLGGPQFHGTATIDGLGDGLLAGGPSVSAIDVAADLKLSKVPLQRLPTLWTGR